VHAAAAAEALVIGRRAGIDLRTLHTALAAGPARSSFVENEALEVLEDGEYGELFPLGLVAKDLGMALELAHESGIPAELSARTRDLYDRVLERYGAAAGEVGVVRHYEDLAGAPLRFGAPDGG
jgi:3-hydroxyisobutyrate dehydrogenase